MSACPNCGADVPAAARFCPACAQAQDPDGLPTMTSPPLEPRGFSPGVASSSDSDSFDHGRFAPGTRLGDRYRIVGRLGVGGMGEVYRADDLKLGQPVALKFLPEAFERDPVRLDKLMAEIRTARQISHPNVCRVYDVGEVDGRRFLTMEYVDGEDLRGLLRRIGHLPEDKGLEIARQICAGLAAIHDRGVLHRDLKPANVMLDGRGRVRLTDFGLATTAAAAGRSGEIAGTPAYMAPEQIAGEPLSAATDFYALGLMLFELFTGERVHNTDRLEDARAGKRTAGATVTLTASGSGAKLDPMIRRVIERCLDADPKRRPQSAIVVAAALPGGDPLAAALAAGETPSPQMVAAAGAEGGLSFKVAVPLLVALLLSVGLLAWQTGRQSYPATVKFPFGPDVLAAKAGEMLTRLGYAETAADSAGGFSSRTSDYSRWVEERDKTATRWQYLARVRPAPLRYWYRTSPMAMRPFDYTASTPGGGLAVGLNDPPRTVSGMTYVELDPEGRLIRFDAVPSDKRVDDPSNPAPDWAAVFKEAGLDFAAFRPVPPEWNSLHQSDASGAWTGPGADPTGAQLRVEAAALRGRLVFFRLLGPWTRPAEVGAANPGTGPPPLLVQIIGFSLILGVPLAAIGLSLRNLRLGRTDTRGAIRLAVAIGGIVALASVLGSTAPKDPSWLQVVVMLMSWAGFSALLVAMFYAAVEPYVRRHWPQMLIGWSRLLDGRWRDPLVGRDLLIGGVLGVAVRLISSFKPVVLDMRGGLPALPGARTDGWMGSRMALAELLARVPEGVWVALGFVVLLVLLRIVLRRELAASLVVVALFVALDASQPGGDRLVNILFGLALVSVPAVVILTRFGLLMFVAFLLMGAFSSLTDGFRTPEFATGALVLSLIATVAPGLFGCYTATRGRKASGWLDT